MMPPPNQKTCQEGLIDQLSRLLREDDRVLAAWLVGSLAQGSGDRFSDIDLYIVPGDPHYEAVFEERENLWSALYHTERLRTGYIQLLSRRAGRDLQEWKALELHDGTELSALKETFCSFNRESVRRGIDTLVELFRSELALLSQKYHVRFAPEQMTHWKGYMQDALRWE